MESSIEQRSGVVDGDDSEGQVDGQGGGVSRLDNGRATGIEQTRQWRSDYPMNRRNDGEQTGLTVNGRAGEQKGWPERWRSRVNRGDGATCNEQTEQWQSDGQ